MLEHREELSQGLAKISLKTLGEQYRRLFGYSKRAALETEDLHNRRSKNLKTTNTRRRHQGREAVGAKSLRKGRQRIAAARQAQHEWGMSREAKQRISLAHTGRAQPVRWKLDSGGNSITDWTLAQLRLDGRTTGQIEAKLVLSDHAVNERLQRMKFPPGEPCQFYRGEPVTAQHLRAHYEDLNFLRFSRALIFGAERQDTHRPLTVEQLAALLKVPRMWIYVRTMQSRPSARIPHLRPGKELQFDRQQVLNWLQKTRHRGLRNATSRLETELARRLGVTQQWIYKLVNTEQRNPRHPLARNLADRLLSSIAILRQEYHQTGSTAFGGRPKKLLPSEEKGLPRKYQALKSDLDLLLKWAERRNERITLEMVGPWMCEQARAGKLPVILFWPSLHAKLPAICERVRNRTHGGGLGSAERAKELICKEYGISRPQLVKAIKEQPGVLAA